MGDGGGAGAGVGGDGDSREEADGRERKGGEGRGGDPIPAALLDLASRTPDGMPDQRGAGRAGRS